MQAGLDLVGVESGSHDRGGGSAVGAKILNKTNG